MQTTVVGVLAAAGLIVLTVAYRGWSRQRWALAERHARWKTDYHKRHGVAVVAVQKVAHLRSRERVIQGPELVALIATSQSDWRERVLTALTLARDIVKERNGD